jgi:hypothetical protein
MSEDKKLLILFFIVIFLFLFSLFKNIGYPLFWQDEGETIALGERVLKFGYPKTYDGKNFLFFFELPDKSLGVKEGLDAHLGSNWGQFYFAALAETIAKNFNDIYLKTAIIRGLFALVGFLGLGVFCLLGTRIFSDSKKKLAFAIVFFIFELISVPLILHLREVRYYPLSLFLIAIILFLYINYRFLKKISFFLYTALLPFSMALLYITFPQAALICFFSLFFYELIYFFANKNSGKLFFSPFLFTLLFFIPMALFFETFKISQAISQYFNFGIKTYLYNLLNITKFFIYYDFLIMMIILKSLILTKEKNNYKEIALGQISLFLSYFFIVYIGMISFVPFIFNRYYIIIQPILTTILILDLHYLVNLSSNAEIRTKTVDFIAVGFLVFFLIKTPIIISHINELFHRYQGPMDFVIPYIQKKSKTPDKLIIATQYEEPVLMYYLKSKVIVGYTGFNLDSDKKLTPDIVIIRKQRPNFLTGLKEFLQRGNYEEINFPVYDYQVNNIPELSLPLKHLFSTPLTDNPDEQITIYWLKNKQ